MIAFLVIGTIGMLIALTTIVVSKERTGKMILANLFVIGLIVASFVVTGRTEGITTASHMRLGKQPILSIVNLHSYKIIKKYSDSLMSEDTIETKYYIDVEDFILPKNIITKRVQTIESVWASVKEDEKLDSKAITEKIKKGVE